MCSAGSDFTKECPELPWDMSLTTLLLHKKLLKAFLLACVPESPLVFWLDVITQNSRDPVVIRNNYCPFLVLFGVGCGVVLREVLGSLASLV